MPIEQFQPDPLSKRWLRYLLLSTVILMGLFFRLYNNSAMPQGAMHDENFYLLDAVKTQKTGDFRVFYADNEGRESILINTLAPLLFAVSADTPVEVIAIARSWVSIVGALSLVMSYLLLLELFRSHPYRYTIAVFSILLLAGSFWHIHYSRMIYRPMFLVLFISTSLFCLFRSFHDTKRRTALLIGSALAAGALVHTYAAYRFFPLVYGLAFWWGIRNGFVSWKHFLGISLIALPVILPMLLFASSYPQIYFYRTSTNSILTAPDIWQQLLKNLYFTYRMFFIRGDERWELLGETQVTKYVQTGLVLLPAFLITTLYTRRSRLMGGTTTLHHSFLWPVFFLICWCVAGVLPQLASNEGNLGLPHSIRVTGMVVPLLTLGSIGICYSWIYGCGLLRHSLLRIFLTLLLWSSGFYYACAGFLSYVEWADKGYTDYQFKIESTKVAPLIFGE